MQIFYNLPEVSKDKNTVVTLGTFDGIHLGHKKIVAEVNKKAELYGARSFVITFYPHPRNVVSKDYTIKTLNTPVEKAVLFEELGIDNVLVIDFTLEFSQLDPIEFFKNYIIDAIGIKEIVIGYDHHFGKGRGGDVETLRELGREYGFEVTTVAEYKHEDETVSSTKIRKALNEGDLKRANAFLGRSYTFSGTVIQGDKRGRKLGFPTANIKLDYQEKLLPALGIYVVEFIVDDEMHYGLLSIGKRPTFYSDGVIMPEVYIYDFDRDIYGKEVTVRLLERLRGEEKFSSAEELVKQMNKDKAAGLKVIKDLK